MQISKATKTLIEAALQEDVGQGDITSQAVIAADAEAAFVFSAREDMVICGLQVAAEILSQAQPALFFEEKYKDGDKLKAGAEIAILRGNVREILKFERVVLNFLQRLSGISTLTAKFVTEACNTNAKILDTRKTTPGWRDLEKYAVRCGGGENHRMRLDDMVLIKDNHIVAAGGIRAAVDKARAYMSSKNSEIKIELEVDTIEQLHEAIAVQPDIIMLDNFSLENLSDAVKLIAGKIPLEASGGVNLQTVRAIAQTGVDRISTSKITQSAPAVDIGLDEC